MLFTPVPTEAARYKKANHQTLGDSAMRAPKPAKMSRATAATTLRLPRSAHTASGTAHRSCDTCAMNATAPSDALDMWNDVFEIRTDEVDAVPEGARDQRGGGEEHEGRVARVLQDADQGGRLALPCARHDREVRHDLGVLDL